MKILSLNTHSLAEPDCEKKLEQFAAVVAEELPDIIGLQEVNQTASAPALGAVEIDGFTACGGIEIPYSVRRDNYAAGLAQSLRSRGIFYYWTWIPVKLGYGKYDEGLAVFSRTPILDTHQFFISRSQEYQNWKTRKLLGIMTQVSGQKPSWFYTVHMGWWDDEEEPFRQQWDRLQQELKERLEAPEQKVWLMGDFNSRDDVRGQGYDCVRSFNWKDTYLLAEARDHGVTVEDAIDGWKGREGAVGNAAGMRIDYIWCSRPAAVQSSRIVCDGRKEPKVSDHNGVMILAG